MFSYKQTNVQNECVILAALSQSIKQTGHNLSFAYHFIYSGAIFTSQLFNGKVSVRIACIHKL